MFNTSTRAWLTWACDELADTTANQLSAPFRQYSTLLDATGRMPCWTLSKGKQVNWCQLFMCLEVASAFPLIWHVFVPILKGCARGNAVWWMLEGCKSRSWLISLVLMQFNVHVYISQLIVLIRILFFSFLHFDFNLIRGAWKTNKQKAVSDTWPKPICHL